MLITMERSDDKIQGNRLSAPPSARRQPKWEVDSRAYCNDNLEGTVTDKSPGLLMECVSFASAMKMAIPGLVGVGGLMNGHRPAEIFFEVTDRHADRFLTS